MYSKTLGKQSDHSESVFMLLSRGIHSQCLAKYANMALFHTLLMYTDPNIFERCNFEG